MTYLPYVFIRLHITILEPPFHQHNFHIFFNSKIFTYKYLLSNVRLNNMLIIYFRFKLCTWLCTLLCTWRIVSMVMQLAMTYSHGGKTASVTWACSKCCLHCKREVGRGIFPREPTDFFREIPCDFILGHAPMIQQRGT